MLLAISDGYGVSFSVNDSPIQNVDKNTSTDEILELATGVALIVNKSRTVEQLLKLTQIDDRRFPTSNHMKQHPPVCGNFRLKDQLSAPDNCTGFLVGENLLMTAGHCIDDIEQFCSDHAIVFDFYQRVVQEESKSASIVNVECEKVVLHKHNRPFDYAVLKLKQRVKNRHIFSIDKKPYKQKGKDVFVMGHPLGTPMKITEPDILIKIEKDGLISTGLDLFAGNSGSPLIAQRTHKVLGIVSHGPFDFDYDSEHRCAVEKDCTDGSCSNNMSFPISAIYGEVKKLL